MVIHCMKPVVDKLPDGTVILHIFLMKKDNFLQEEDTIHIKYMQEYFVQIVHWVMQAHGEVLDQQ